MAPFIRISVIAIVFLNGVELITANNENQLEDLRSSRIIQHLQVNREKRGTKDEGCCKDPSWNQKGSSFQPQPIVVNHYHNYYYNCPCVPNQLPQVPPQSASSVCSPQTKCVDCTCDKSGSISCSVPQSPASSYPQQQSPPQGVGSPATYQQGPQTYQQGPQSHGYAYQPSPQYPSNVYQQNAESQRSRQPFADTYQPGVAVPRNLTGKDKNTAFSFSMMFDDPVAKDFYDFVTTNFVKRDIPLQIAEIECASDPLSVFEDPICKEFFNLFTQTFVKKPENATSGPELSQSATQNATNFQNS